MKTMKKIGALVLAVVMAMALAVPATAVSKTDEHTISVASTDTHTYKVYQVLKGTLAAEGDKEMGDIEWGADVTGKSAADLTAFLATLETDKADQAKVADDVFSVVNGNGQGTVDKDHPMTVTTGYYIMVDVTDPLPENDALALHVVQVVNDVTVTVKHETTSSDKEIVAATEVTVKDQEAKAITYDLDNDTKNEVGDVDIGGTVTYKLTGTIPANAADYDYYFYYFNDTLGKGLTLNVNAENEKATFIVKAGDDTLTADDYSVEIGDYSAENGTTFHVYLTNAKALAGKTITVQYSATLNENAEIGETANENDSTVTFSNDPNHDYNGDKDTTTPGKPKQDVLDDGVLGETPEQKTETYTTGIELLKVDQDGNALKGAEFTITGPSTKIVLVSEETFTKVTENGTYYKLKDGTYTTKAPVEGSESYREIGTGDADTTEGYLKRDGSDEYYIPEDKTEYIGKTVYEKVTTTGTADQYVKDATSGDYEMYTKTTTFNKVGEGQTQTNIRAEVGPDGVVRFVGLNEGTYTISETKTPAGYDTIPDFDVTIAFTADPATGEKHWSATSDFVKDSTNTTGAVSYNNQVFQITVENVKGNPLPETGGIGTKIFYTMGAVLVIGAGVVLVSRKRAAE